MKTYKMELFDSHNTAITKDIYSDGWKEAVALAKIYSSEKSGVTKGNKVVVYLDDCTWVQAENGEVTVATSVDLFI